MITSPPVTLNTRRDYPWTFGGAPTPPWTHRRPRVSWLARSWLVQQRLPSLLDPPDRVRPPRRASARRREHPRRLRARPAPRRDRPGERRVADGRRRAGARPRRCGARAPAQPTDLGGAPRRAAGPHPDADRAVRTLRHRLPPLPRSQGPPHRRGRHRYGAGGRPGSPFPPVALRRLDAGARPAAPTRRRREARAVDPPGPHQGGARAAGVRAQPALDRRRQPPPQRLDRRVDHPVPPLRRLLPVVGPAARAGAAGGPADGRRRRVQRLGRPHDRRLPAARSADDLQPLPVADGPDRRRRRDRPPCSRGPGR